MRQITQRRITARAANCIGVLLILCGVFGLIACGDMATSAPSAAVPLTNVPASITPDSTTVVAVMVAATATPSFPSTQLPTITPFAPATPPVTNSVPSPTAATEHLTSAPITGASSTRRPIVTPTRSTSSSATPVLPTKAAAVGYLTIQVLSGPHCPVEAIDKPCPPQPVVRRAVTIWDANGVMVQQGTTDANGLVTTTLVAGTYQVRVARLGIVRGVAQDATIVAGQTQSLTLFVDTGIR